MELKYCKVKFDGYNNDYDFLNLAQTELAVGDEVLLKCASGIQKGIITKVNTPKGKSNHKAYVFQKIDTSYAERVLAQIEEKEALIKQMEEREQELARINQYKALAISDEKMEQLYNKYVSLD